MSNTQHHAETPRGLMLCIDLNEEFEPPNDYFLTNLARTIRSEMQALLPPRSNLALSLITSDTKATAPIRPIANTAKTRADPTTPEAAVKSHVVAKQQGRLFIDRTRDEVTLEGEPLHLTGKELQILNYLVDNSPRIVGREELITHLWSSDGPVPSLRTVDVHVRRLRRRLGSSARHVRSVRGKGYHFEHGDRAVIWKLPEYSI